MEPSKTNPTRWEWHHNNFTPSLHLVPFCQLCFVFVSCVHRRVVEGSGMGSAGCGVHVDVHGYVVGGCNVVAILRMAGMVCLELLVLQARPFLRSADHFQYAAHRGKKFDVWIYNFTSKHLWRFSSTCRYWKRSALWNGKGLACETSLECRNCGVHELGLYGMLE